MNIKIYFLKALNIAPHLAQVCSRSFVRKGTCARNAMVRVPRIWRKYAAIALFLAECPQPKVCEPMSPHLAQVCRIAFEGMGTCALIEF